MSAAGSAAAVASPGRKDSASASFMPGASPAATAAGLTAARRCLPPAVTIVANGASSAGAPTERLGTDPSRRSRSIGQLGRKRYMTRRIGYLHIPAARLAAAYAQQCDPPARPADPRL